MSARAEKRAGVALASAVLLLTGGACTLANPAFFDTDPTVGSTTSGVDTTAGPDSDPSTSTTGTTGPGSTSTDGTSSTSGVSSSSTTAPATTTGIGSTSSGEPACGDGVQEGDELCDDGNEYDFDVCNSACSPNPYAVVPTGEHTGADVIPFEMQNAIFDFCDEDAWLIGVRVQVPENPPHIGRLQRICAPILLGPGDNQFEYYHGDKQHGMIYGDPEGMMQTAECPDGMVVVGYQGFTEGALTQLTIFCAGFDGFYDGQGGHEVSLGPIEPGPGVGVVQGNETAEVVCDPGLAATESIIVAPASITGFGAKCQLPSLAY